MSAPAIRGISQKLSQTNDCLNGLICEIKNYMRPRVIVRVRPLKTSVNILNFEVINLGNTPAYNISCHFNPDIEYAKTGINLSKLPVFNNLSVLAPHEILAFFFASAIEYLNDKSKPMEIDVIVEYEDENQKRYENRILIKINELEKINFIEEKGLDDIVSVLKSIERRLDRIENSMRKSPNTFR